MIPASLKLSSCLRRLADSPHLKVPDPLHHSEVQRYFDEDMLHGSVAIDVNHTFVPRNMRVASTKILCAVYEM